MSWEVSDIETVKRMAIEGATATEASLALKKSVFEIDAIAELLGLAFGTPVELLWCNWCAKPVVWLDPETGYCLACSKKFETEEVIDEIEAERLAIEAEVAERAAVEKRNRRKWDQRLSRARKKVGRRPRADLKRPEPPEGEL